MKLLRLFLVLLLILPPLPPKVEAQFQSPCVSSPNNNQQVTCRNTKDPQVTILSTFRTSGGSQSWEIGPGITTHSLSFAVSAGITSITVTFAGSTDGGATFGTTIGTATTTGGTITGTGTFAAARMSLTFAGSGYVDATYIGGTNVDNVYAFAKYFADGTKALPSIAFANSTGTGFSWSAANSQLVTSVSGGAVSAVDTATMRLSSSETFSWSSGDPTVSAGDTFLGRGGSGILYLANANALTTNTGQLGDATHVIKDIFLNGSAGGNATTGAIGETVSSTVTSGALVNLATGSATTITSITLAAGDWDVDGTVYYRLNASTSVTVLAQASNAVGTGILDTQEAARTTFETAANVMGSGADPSFNIPTTRYSLSTTKIIYLASNAVFTVSTAQAYGQIRARRIR